MAIAFLAPLTVEKSATARDPEMVTAVDRFVGDNDSGAVARGGYCFQEAERREGDDHSQQPARHYGTSLTAAAL